MLSVIGSKSIIEIKWKEYELLFHAYFIYEGLTSLLYISSQVIDLKGWEIIINIQTANDLLILGMNENKMSVFISSENIYFEHTASNESTK